MKDQEIQNMVRERRLSLNLTQAELAEKVGIARISITAIETGRHQPTIGTALKLSKALGLPVDDLFWINEGSV